MRRCSKLNASILEITAEAGVGVGSLYNHFTSKEQLLDAAVGEVLDAHGTFLDECTAAISDPADAFATSFRLTAGLFRRRPQEGQIVLRTGVSMLDSNRGLAARALRDIKAALDTGCFKIDDADLAVALAGGALLGLGHLLYAQPDRDGDQAADEVTGNVLRLFGMTTATARRLSQRPLPGASMSMPSHDEPQHLREP